MQQLPDYLARGEIDEYQAEKFGDKSGWLSADTYIYHYWLLSSKLMKTINTSSSNQAAIIGSMRNEIASKLLWLRLKNPKAIK